MITANPSHCEELVRGELLPSHGRWDRGERTALRARGGGPVGERHRAVRSKLDVRHSHLAAQRVVRSHHGWQRRGVRLHLEVLINPSPPHTYIHTRTNTGQVTTQYLHISMLLKLLEALRISGNCDFGKPSCRERDAPEVACCCSQRNTEEVPQLYAAEAQREGFTSAYNTDLLYHCYVVEQLRPRRIWQTRQCE